MRPLLARVGQPIEEAKLTRSFDSSVGRLVRPGAGRSAYVVSEAEAPIGRPDVLVVVASSAVVDKYIADGIRVPNVTASKLLFDLDSSDRRTEHLARVESSLRGGGWSRARARRLALAVHDSLAIEAKVSDWRKGLRQVSRFRRSFQRSALLLPGGMFTDPLKESLLAYGCGLLLSHAGRVEWRFESTKVEPPLWARLWALELVARSIESGSGYRAVSRPKRSIASR